jgi:hypothetical protein
VKKPAKRRGAFRRAPGHWVKGSSRRQLFLEVVGDVIGGTGRTGLFGDGVLGPCAEFACGQTKGRTFLGVTGATDGRVQIAD